MITIWGNRFLDEVITPHITIGRNTTLSAYQLFGTLGFLLGTIWGVWLSARQGLSALLFIGLAVVGMLTFLGLTLILKIITGEEVLTNYHGQIAAILAAVGILWLIDGPILPYLDAFAVGLGIFIALGRIGCLMVGCCHGCPHEWGVCYRPEHVDDGFVAYLVNVRLFPTQLIESLLTLVIVGLCSGLIIAGFAPGSALAWYGVAYSTLRFVLEFWRADNQRPFWWGISETHWLSLLIVLVIILLEWAGFLPFFEIHLIVGGTLLLWMLFLVYQQRWTSMLHYNVLYPPHFHEIAQIIERDFDIGISQADTLHAHLSTTSLGIHISASRLEDEGHPIHHYAFSRQQPPLTAEMAQTLTELILKLKHREGSPELIHSREGVFHLLVRSGGSVK